MDADDDLCRHECQDQRQGSGQIPGVSRAGSRSRVAAGPVVMASHRLASAGQRPAELLVAVAGFRGQRVDPVSQAPDDVKHRANGGQAEHPDQRRGPADGHAEDAGHRQIGEPTEDAGPSWADRLEMSERGRGDRDDQRGQKPFGGHGSAIPAVAVRAAVAGGLGSRVATCIASPRLDALPDGDGRDHQSSDRVGPAPAHQCVQQQTDEQHRRPCSEATLPQRWSAPGARP
jgi:hypothetical protein